MKKRIVIIGAGPTGLGAAYRLNELGYQNWKIYEKNSFVGGLASSFRDKKGFTWDIGGHVLFSHYDRFNQVFEKLLKGEYVCHERKAFIRLFDRWIPYPFQNNIRYLPKKALLECLHGLIEAKGEKTKPKNFNDWIFSTFGKGIAKYFMVPHNRKVWAYPLSQMDINWIGERVSVVDVKRILDNISSERDDVAWGPNNSFKFPLYGGTGNIFSRIASIIKDHLVLNSELTAIDSKRRELIFRDDLRDSYGCLINTSPLTTLIKILRPARAGLRENGKMLKHNSIFVVGLGLAGRCPENKCWVYTPEEKSPFFRVTYFSNYSPFNVPVSRRYWSLMCEVAYSKLKPEREETVISQTIKGLQNCSMLDSKAVKKIVSRVLIKSEFAYPIPAIGRDSLLKYIQGSLEDNSIFSRGRFGAWKYEVGNLDHSFMQGMEIADRLVLNKKESVWQK